MPLTYTLESLANHVGGKVAGNEKCEISSIATLQSAQEGDISFFINATYKSQLKETRAAAVILTQDAAQDCPTNSLIVNTPHAAYAKIAQLLYPKPTITPATHNTAVIDPSAHLAEEVYIGPHAVIEADVTISKGSYIGPHCYIATGSQIGEDCTLIGQVTVCDHSVIGDRVILHPGVVIGSDGFGQAFDENQWIKIPQIGIVEVGNDVEIGSNTTIDRGAVENTIIEEGVKLDNQIHIAHNVKIGAHTIMAANSGVSGSVTIGRNCMIAGMVGIAGHLSIADNVFVTGMSIVTKSIKEAGTYSSSLSAEKAQVWRKNFARFRQLDDLNKRVKELERHINDKGEKN